MLTVGLGSNTAGLILQFNIAISERTESSTYQSNNEKHYYRITNM